MSDAIEIADYFLREIVRLMNVSHQDAVAKDALLVANWLHARGDSCMIKEFSQGGPKRLRKVANRAPAFELLYRAGWMKEAGSSLVLNPLCSERGLLSIDSAANDANGAI